MWYPAREEPGQTSMSYGDYFDDVGKDWGIHGDSAKLREQVIQNFMIGSLNPSFPDQTGEKEMGRKNYKYDLSYEEIGQLIKRHIPTYAIEIEKFFRLVLFNYIFSNGDAHVRNFSAIQTDEGDHVLTPAYDLLCTRVHSPGEADMALTLFKDRFTEAYEAHGFYTYDDFLEFGKVLGTKESRVVKIIEEFNGKEESVDKLVDASFLRDDIKVIYKNTYKDKTTRLSIRYKK